MKYTLKKTLPKSKGYPVTSKSFEKANAEADVYEKRKYPKGYAELKKIDKKLPKGQILGHQTKSGKVVISKKVPKKRRNEVADREVFEHRMMRKR